MDSDDRLIIKHYVRSDNFDFSIIYIPCMYSTIPAASAHRYIYIFLLIRYSRVCNFYQDFLDTYLLPTRKLQKQWFLMITYTDITSKLCRSLSYLGSFHLSRTHVSTHIFTSLFKSFAFDDL